MPGYFAGAVFVKVTVNRGLDVPDPCCTAHRPATDLRHRLLPVSSLRPAAVKTSRTNRYRERCRCQSVDPEPCSGSTLQRASDSSAARSEERRVCTECVITCRSEGLA